MKEFYIKDMNALPKYGFQEDYHGHDAYVFVFHNRTPSIWINKQTGHLTIQSPSKEAISIICEMYKNGVLEIIDIDDNKTATVRMNLTPEEAAIIHTLRNGKRNE